MTKPTFEMPCIEINWLVGPVIQSHSLLRQSYGSCALRDLYGNCFHQSLCTSYL